ncbi:nuclear transport factor 2 family protein [Methylobacterium sp. BTF04]|uniref:nuclear transport factor 2 family protein n=1 Tax=Methylobacterium sp. BTF04 TaxID=2708300 RepID=UPI0013D2263F|nr:nuclear transport factor 2 family protein [Methylobacterium sp. BTF04]NEU12649.1 nuclear transport factor 2 family protein [Methylobacterium sp. BTF04]
MTTTETTTERAHDPEDLARLFIARANAGDTEGLVALYEPDAVLAAGAVVATGHQEIRRFYTDLLARRSEFPSVEALPALRNGLLAMTFARLPNGTISVETARQQADGGWLWVIDQLKIKPLSPAQRD